MIGLALSVFPTGPSLAQAQSAHPITTAEEGPLLVELFTSQSCSSCPPAETYFTELADRDDLVIIEWHVDYWDDLVYGRAGAWKDPYSDPEYTKRQRAYAQQIHGNRRVYTPQAVIAGAEDVVGSNRRDVRKAIRSAAPPSVIVSTIDGEARIEGELAASEDGDATVRFVRLLKDQTTRVPRGENHGRTLSSANIALETKVLGQWEGASDQRFQIPGTGEGETCAIIVETKAGVLGAAYCQG